MYCFACVYVSAPCNTVPHRDQKKVLELQRVVCCHVGAGIKPMSSTRAAGVLNY